MVLCGGFGGMKTTDLYPELSPFERQMQFIISRQGEISQVRYRELLAAHYQVKRQKAWHIPTETKQTLITKIKQLWQKIKN